MNRMYIFFLENVTMRRKVLKSIDYTTIEYFSRNLDNLMIAWQEVR